MLIRFKPTSKTALPTDPGIALNVTGRIVHHRDYCYTISQYQATLVENYCRKNPSLPECLARIDDETWAIPVKFCFQ